MPEYNLYILYSNSIDRYYIGISANPETRLKYHNTFYKGWTKHGRPWRLVFTRTFISKKQARIWEKKLKNTRRTEVLEQIIAGQFEWKLHLNATDQTNVQANDRIEPNNSG